MTPIATTDWFEVSPLGSGITRIIERPIDAFLQASMWHFEGDRDLLVDTGVGVRPIRSAMPRLQEREPIVVLTHAHVDHAGGARGFLEVLMHPSDARHPHSGLGARLDGTAMSAALGLSRRSVLAMRLVDVDEATEIARAGSGPDGPVTPIVDGDRIDLGSRVLEVIGMPGHTAGSIGLLDRRAGLLVTGDALYDGVLIDDLPSSDPAEYATTMRTILDLDVDVVLPGHGPAMTGAQARALARGYLARRHA